LNEAASQGGKLCVIWKAIDQQTGKETKATEFNQAKPISPAANLIGLVLSKRHRSSRNQAGMGRTWQLHRQALPSLLTILMIPMVAGRHF
jgi:hypothetical protein